MKYSLFITVIFTLFFSCSGKPDERSLIEQEKEKLRIQDQARKELIKEDETRILNADIDFQILRIENSFLLLDQAKTEMEKLEAIALIETTFDRLIRTDKNFIWHTGTIKWDFTELKTFEIEFQPDKETEKSAKAKIYLEAKKIGGNGIIEFRSPSDSQEEEGKFSGTIIKVDLPE